MLQRFSFKSYIYIGITFFVMLAIFLFSSQSKEVSGAWSDMIARIFYIPQQDKSTSLSNQALFLGMSFRKFAHMIIYFWLSISTCISIQSILYDHYGSEREIGGYDYIWILLFCFLYACSDEIHQIFSNRGAAFTDVLIDSLGAIIGMGCYRVGKYLYQFGR